MRATAPGFLAILTACVTAGPHSDELHALYRADQQEREADWSDFQDSELRNLIERDRQRRQRVLEIVRADGAVTAGDRYHAAMVLQHGDRPEDFLLAHVLAAAAAFDGLEDGRWLSAAALDRYLHSIDRPQWFDTQYSRDSADGPWTMEPREDWLPAFLRRSYRAPSPAEAEAVLQGLNGQ